MALSRSSIGLALLALQALALPALADSDEIYNALGRSDTVSLGAGDATRANLAIQHPTPWPPRVNDTRIPTPSLIGIGALENMFRRYQPNQGGSISPSTVVNIGSVGSN